MWYPLLKCYFLVSVFTPNSKLQIFKSINLYSGYAVTSLDDAFYVFGGYKYVNGYRDTKEIFKMSVVGKNRKKLLILTLS